MRKVKKDTKETKVPLPEINKRLDKIIQHISGGNRTAFAESIGVFQQRINRIFALDTRGEKEGKEGSYGTISEDMFVGIANNHKEINIYWLLTGEGSMLVTTNYDQTLAAAMATQKENTQLPPGVKELIDVLKSQNEILKKGFSLDDDLNRIQEAQPLQKAVSVVLKPGLDVDIQMSVLPKKDV